MYTRWLFLTPLAPPTVYTCWLSLSPHSRFRRRWVIITNDDCWFSPAFVYFVIFFNLFVRILSRNEKWCELRAPRVSARVEKRGESTRKTGFHWRRACACVSYWSKRHSFLIDMAAVERLYSQTFQVRIKSGSALEDRKSAINIAIELHSSSSSKRELKIQLTDDDDLFFLFSLSLGKLVLWVALRFFQSYHLFLCSSENTICYEIRL